MFNTHEPSDFDNKAQLYGHVYRAGSRASFLYPSWLAKSCHSKQTIKGWLRLSFLHLKLLINKIFDQQNYKRAAYEHFLRCLIIEQRIRQISEENEWEKNTLHYFRQQQLRHFEIILKNMYTSSSSNDSTNLVVCPFPEIILVMAQTLVEGSSSMPDLITSAKTLLTSYDQLREFLFTQSLLWRPCFFKIPDDSIFIEKLEIFLSAWKKFKEQRASFITIEDSHDEKYKRINDSVSLNHSSFTNDHSI